MSSTAVNNRGVKKTRGIRKGHKRYQKRFVGGVRQLTHDKKKYIKQDGKTSRIAESITPASTKCSTSK